MRELPEMFCSLGFAGDEEFVYGVTYFSVQEEQRRGATADEIREQGARFFAISMRPIGRRTTVSFSLRFSPVPSKTALEGREPCVLH